MTVTKYIYGLGRMIVHFFEHVLMEASRKEWVGKDNMIRLFTLNRLGEGAIRDTQQ